MATIFTDYPSIDLIIYITAGRWHYKIAISLIIRVISVKMS
jgi:hypothetical protein